MPGSAAEYWRLTSLRGAEDLAGARLALDLDAGVDQRAGHELGRPGGRRLHAVAVVEPLVAGEGGERAALELQAALPVRHRLQLVEPGSVTQDPALDLLDALALERAREVLERGRREVEDVALVGARREAGVAEPAEVQVAVQHAAGGEGHVRGVELGGEAVGGAPVDEGRGARHQLHVGCRRVPRGGVLLVDGEGGVEVPHVDAGAGAVEPGRAQRVVDGGVDGGGGGLGVRQDAAAGDRDEHEDEHESGAHGPVGCAPDAGPRLERFCSDCPSHRGSHTTMRRCGGEPA